jgi:two-component sensor histidine kinase
VTAFLGLPRNWPLLTKLIMALAIAMVPMVILAAVLAAAEPVAFADHAPSTVRWSLAILALLMWLSAMMMSWFSIHRLVTGPLYAIERLMADYGQSSDPARTRLRSGDRDHGSAEINALAACFDEMADQIDRHTRELAGALVEQQRLTREVHHRVKNNLQIISSLLSLQARDALTPEIMQTYAVIQARIAALTHVHRWMYDDATSNGVDLKSLVGELCAGLQSSLVSPNHPDVTITFQTAAIVIHPDIAVPVAFLLTELASLAALYGTPGPLHIGVTTVQDAGFTTLTVTAPGFDDVDRIAATSMTPTARIIHGMARQLRSTLVHDPVGGNYSVSFSATAPRPAS